MCIRDRVFLWSFVFILGAIPPNVIEKSIMVGIPATRIGDATKGFQPYAVTDKDKD